MNDDAADAAWLEQHRGLVMRIANEVASRYRLRRFMDDLLAFGQEGLLEARVRFEPERGLAFSTYAWHVIRGRILDGCRSMGLVARRRGPAGGVTFSRTTSIQIQAESIFNEHQLAALEDDPAAALPAPSPRPLEDIAADLDAIVSDAAAIFLLADAAQSLEDRPDPSPTPADQVEEKDSAAFVRHQVAALAEDDRRVLEMSFFEERTLDDIAAHFGCTRSWASRMRSAALRRLRERITAAEEALP